MINNVSLSVVQRFTIKCPCQTVKRFQPPRQYISKISGQRLRAQARRSEYFGQSDAGIGARLATFTSGHARSSSVLLRYHTLLEIDALECNMLHAHSDTHASANALSIKCRVLCGCGSLDGTEVTEAVSLAINLNLNGFKPAFFAPNIEICGVMDHLCNQPDTSGVARNALVEAARIARSEVRPLCECDCNSGTALILPGGFGCAKTLSDFATKGAECTVLPDLERVITEFALSKKPIGAICMAPVLVAKVLCGTKITLGKSPPEKWPHCATIAEAKKMGAKHEERNVTQVTHCKQHNVFSTPAWMYNGTFAEVHDGIGRLVKALKKKMK
ncbi:glutamine amidotransferase-like class 1 domain-containing protein 3, mitochondrial [Diprion similis]|uniref:glutamine amidotransferase-like class 1 domain-containing protein 3, mitochondrial n=1 Tax=Diprion similis TaxID=362088 RepID=UPI001EF8FFF6|nr:glutamine amidotransferase-like class 1 domain-containing protein 3, mitochondrial [Diprion similis]